MWAVYKKELRQFFSNLTGYIAIIIFLLVNGLFLFVFSDNIFDAGYSTLDRFFEFAPWILLLLIPAITMRSLSDEFRGGTFEILRTRPLSTWEVIGGKYLASLTVMALTLLATFIYFYSVQHLSSQGGIDVGGTVGSYIGLFFLASVFVSMGLCCSCFTNNAVVSFIAGVFVCYFLYNGFHAISGLSPFVAGADYYIEMLGLDFHYRSISRGVIDSRDLIYFLSLIGLFLFITNRRLINRT